MDLKLTCGSCGQHVVVDSAAGGSTVACPSCATPLSVPEVIQAGPPKKTFSVFRTLLLLVLIVGVLGVLAFVASLATDKPSDEAGNAYYAAKKFCERYAPSATKFTTDNGGDYLDGKAKWATNYNGHCDWYASGYVDCQNRYGAMRHQTWGAHVMLTGGKWHLNYLAIGQETLVGGD